MVAITDRLRYAINSWLLIHLTPVDNIPGSITSGAIHCPVVYTQ